MSDRLSPSRNRASPKRRKLVAMVLVGGAAAIGLAATINMNWPTASIVGANPDDPAQVAMGRAVYQQNCGPCWLSSRNPGHRKSGGVRIGGAKAPSNDGERVMG